MAHHVEAMGSFSRQLYPSHLNNFMFTMTIANAQHTDTAYSLHRLYEQQF